MTYPVCIFIYTAINLINCHITMHISAAASADDLTAVAHISRQTSEKVVLIF